MSDALPKDFPYQHIIDHTCVFTAVIDENMELRQFNERFSDLLGLSTCGSKKQLITDFLINASDWSRSITVLKKKNTSLRVTLRFINKSNVPVHIKCSLGKSDHQYYLIGIDTTEDVLAHKALDRVTQIANLGAWTYNPYNDETYWSDKLFEILELPKNTPVNGETIFDYVHPEDNNAFLEAVQKIYIALEPYDIKIRVYTAKGNLKWIRIAAYPENGVDQVLFIYGLFQDITIAEKALIEIKELKETMEMALMAMKSGHFTFDMVNDDISYSKGFRELLGFDDHLTKEEFRLLIHPDDREIAEERHVESIKRSSQHYYNHYRLKNANGLYQHYEVHGWKIYNARGEIVKMIGNLINVEKRYILQQDKKKHERRMEALINNAFLHSILLDKDFKIIAADLKTQHRLTQIIGVNPVKHQSDYTAVLDYNKSKEFNQLRDYLKGGQQLRVEQRHHFLEKDAIYDTLYLPVPGLDPSQPQNYLIYFFDISEQLKLRKELQNAKKQLLDMNELKSDIINKVGHELKTPISSLLLTTDLLVQNADSNLEDLLKAQKESVDRINSTFDNIINQSLIDQTYLPVTSKVNITDVMKSQINIARSKCLSKNLELIAQNFKEKIQIDADAAFINQAIGNILDNAVKFTEKGKIKIECRTNDDLAVIMIEDTGIGIQKGEFSSIFEPFYQESTGDTRNYQGNGLGLSFSKKYLKAIQGNISVSSVKGYGSMFTISLPLTKLNHKKVHRSVF